jgi:hypothetical protein
MPMRGHFFRNTYTLLDVCNDAIYRRVVSAPLVYQRGSDAIERALLADSFLTGVFSSVQWYRRL